MGVFKAFSMGMWSAVRVKKIIAFVFIINLVFGLSLAVPLYDTLHNSFGNTEVRNDMMHGFNYQWWIEFQHDNTGFVTSFNPSITGIGAVLNNIQALFYGSFVNSLYSPIFIMALIFMIMNTFFTGGLLAIYKSEEQFYTMKEFFKGCGKYFFKFLRLLLISLVLYVVVYIWGRGLLDSLHGYLTQNAGTERFVVILGFVKDIIIIFVIFLINMIFDYAKVRTVLEEGKWMIIETLKSISFIFSNFFRALLVYYLYALLGLIFIVLYWLGHTYIPQVTIWMIVAAIAVQQVYIIINIWVRYSLLGSEMAFYKGNTITEIETGGEAGEESAETGIM